MCFLSVFGSYLFCFLGFYLFFEGQDLELVDAFELSESISGLGGHFFPFLLGIEELS